MDSFTVRNLELFMIEQWCGHAHRYHDHTTTAMWRRAAQRWMAFPLKEIASIEKRHDVVSLAAS
jgi:DNA mismatch repair ATPase MutS